MFRRRRNEPSREELVASVPFWWHSIDLGDGLVTPGGKSLAQLEAEWATCDLGDLAGLSVLDIGAWDGFFSFKAERAGAGRVVALDQFVWSLDLGVYSGRTEASGLPAEERLELAKSWPKELRGKRGFDISRQLLCSRVEDRVADFMAADLERLGRFDVVLFLGVLYHMTDPLGALRRVRHLTGGVAVVETEAIVFPGLDETLRLVEFYPGKELVGDPTNWWAPTLSALVGLCEAAGFSTIEVKAGPPAHEGSEPLHYRAFLHAS